MSDKPQKQSSLGIAADFPTLLLYGEKFWQWETLTNSLQKVIGRVKFGEFAMYIAS